jgi:hypothetical protein
VFDKRQGALPIREESMKSITVKAPARDEIDSIVDGLLADPSRVDDVKGVLRRRFALVAPHAALVQMRQVERATPARNAALSSDDDDLWENVPV